MMTFQGMRMRTEWMMEQMRLNAIDVTVEKFMEAARRYYETSEGGREVTALIHELEALGMDPEEVIDLDLGIRDEVFGL